MAKLKADIAVMDEHLEVGALRKSPAMLKFLLPKLTTEVELPPNPVELL